MTLLYDLASPTLAFSSLFNESAPASLSTRLSSIPFVEYLRHHRHNLPRQDAQYHFLVLCQISFIARVLHVNFPSHSHLKENLDLSQFLVIEVPLGNQKVLLFLIPKPDMYAFFTKIVHFAIVIHQLSILFH